MNALAGFSSRVAARTTGTVEVHLSRLFMRTSSVASFMLAVVASASSAMGAVLKLRRLRPPSWSSPATVRMLALRVLG